MAAKIGRPANDEYAPYYEQYIKQAPGDDPVAALRLLRNSTEEVLSRLDEKKAAHRYAPGKWTVKEVIGHITDAERVFAFRALWFARQKDGALPGFDENQWMPASGFAAQPLARVVDAWRAQRLATITLFESLPEGAWQARGTANNKPVSVRALAWIAAGHEVHHLAVLKERYGVA